MHVEPQGLALTNPLWPPHPCWCIFQRQPHRIAWKQDACFHLLLTPRHSQFEIKKTANTWLIVFSAQVWMWGLLTWTEAPTQIQKLLDCNVHKSVFIIVLSNLFHQQNSHPVRCVTSANWFQSGRAGSHKGKSAWIQLCGSWFWILYLQKSLLTSHPTRGSIVLKISEPKRHIKIFIWDLSFTHIGEMHFCDSLDSVKTSHHKVT